MKKIIATYLTIIISLGFFITCSGDDPANINSSTSSENEKFAAQLTVQETVKATNQLVTEAANQGIAYNTNPAIKAYLAMFQGVNEWTHTGKLSPKQKDIIKQSILQLDIQLTKENPVGVVPAAFAISGTASSFTISGSINGPDGGTLAASGGGSFSSPNYSMNILYTYTDYSIGGYIINGTTSVTMNGSNGNFTMTVAGNLSFSGLWTGSIQFTLSVTVANGGATFTFSGTINGTNINGTNQVATPTFSPSPGTYSSTQNISISTTTSGASIRYTTGDGTQAAPTSTTGTLYSVPISVSSSTVIKAIAYKNGTPDSAIVQGGYTVNTSKASAPTFSPAPGYSWAPRKVTISSTTIGVIIKYTTDGSDPKVSSTAQFSNPVDVNTSMTIKAYAYKSGISDSDVATAIYTRVIVNKGVASQYNDDIYIMNSDGNGWTNLTNNIALDRSPSISSAGKIVFYSTIGGMSQVYSMNDDGSSLTNLSNNAFSNFNPSISSDGSKIAFLSQELHATGDIFIMNADGSGQTNLTNDTLGYYSCSISGDGSKIAFESGYDIYIMNSDGTGLTNLTNDGSTNNDSSPSISSDGSRIVFDSNRNGGRGIFIMNADGSGLIQLTTNNIGGDFAPSISSDGSKIVFQLDNFLVGSGIYIMNLDGSEKYNLGSAGTAPTLR